MKKILVVEDEADIRETMEILLKMEGFPVETAANGQEALNLLKSSEPPCVILLDLMMPVMDGIEFLKRVKNDPSLVKIPIIVTTAFRDRASQLDVKRVLIKPISLDVLLSAIKEYC